MFMKQVLSLIILAEDERYRVAMFLQMQSLNTHLYPCPNQIL